MAAASPASLRSLSTESRCLFLRSFTEKLTRQTIKTVGKAAGFTKMIFDNHSEQNCISSIPRSTLQIGTDAFHILLSSTRGKHFINLLGLTTFNRVSQKNLG